MRHVALKSLSYLLASNPLCRPLHCRRAMATMTREYSHALEALNSLQTPFSARGKTGSSKRRDMAMHEMRVYLTRIGYSSQDVDRLNVIHVAGTKGKGSTCAFANSILSHYQRTHGIPRKIGLLTSPHLVAVRERIRINSVPISEEAFARYFFEVWDLLSAPSTPDAGVNGDGDEVLQGSKPTYARYLTLMSYHVFLSEGVDVAVYETGVGGEFDSTNLVAHPVATGISTLGIDHVQMLGDTVDKIAWHKAGIMKTGSPAFVVEQVPEAEAVLRQRAVEKGVHLEVLAVDRRLRGVAIRPNALFQKKNATLAIALAEAALGKIDPGFAADPAALSREFVDGLEQVVWRGRCEVKPEGKVMWHVDGAHTADSLRVAGRWFVDECSGRTGPRVLIFNQQGREEAIDFLDGLYDASKHDATGRSFDRVIFCTNVTYANASYKPDFVNLRYDPEAIAKLTAQKAFAAKWALLDPLANVRVASSIEEAINTVRGLVPDLKETDTVQAFITGSLHLVGAALAILEGADAL